MSNKLTKTAPKRINWLKVFLILTGLILTFGWAICVSSFDFLWNLSCTISPQACYQGSSLADNIIRTPLILGSLLLPLGIVYNKNLDIVYKLAIVLVSAFILYYVAFYFLIFIGIAHYGLGPR